MSRILTQLVYCKKYSNPEYWGNFLLNVLQIFGLKKNSNILTISLAQNMLGIVYILNIFHFRIFVK